MKIDALPYLLEHFIEEFYGVLYDKFIAIYLHFPMSLSMITLRIDFVLYNP